MLTRLAAELRLLLGDERVDLVLHLRRARKREAWIEPVALAVDTCAVHRDEEAGVWILLGDRGDPGAVEGEVRADVDVEEVDGRTVAVDPRRPLPHRPAVVVASGRDFQRLGYRH